MERNIALAVEREKDYLERKFNNHEEVKIFDFIGDCGYDDINVFHWDKQAYLFKTSEYIVEEEPYIDLKLAYPYINNNTPAFLYTIDCDEDYIFLPTNYVEDEETKNLLDEHGLKRVFIGYNARNGVIISSNGDLRIFLIYNGEVELPTDFISTFLQNELSEYYDNVVIDGNDILIDGKKVIGTAFIPFNDMNVFVCQCSFVDKLELIQQICGNSVKTPGNIDPNIISPEKIKDDFIVWLNQL